MQSKYFFKRTNNIIMDLLLSYCNFKLNRDMKLIDLCIIVMVYNRYTDLLTRINVPVCFHREITKPGISDTNNTLIWKSCKETDA